ncbi:TIGR03085 family metal-binding protein [Auritidibacter ignavus]|uniref:TIGR03085 family metal-binding protein n=1 Tax=Auritidibacter ignavus TaxID=678932 RepID=UPI00244B723C|nr:TIGR03085 family metal-binding protein [Auritidibacter ignavus]WGH91234.1 TIGR03085 family metal-binding protein [Auritidibacter ignavus]
MTEKGSGALTGADDFVAASRDALVSALLAAGPDQPTLCEGWQTQHLVAHLHLRESSPLAAGLLFAPLSEKLHERTMELGDQCTSVAEYHRLVEQFARGPKPGQKPSTARKVATTFRRTFAGKRLAEVSNLLEFFVHTEDIRRAQNRWAPRKLAQDYASALFEQLSHTAKWQYKKSSVGVALVRSNGERIVAKNGSEFTYITGPAGELVMHAFGRTDHALVLIDQA